MAYDDPCAKYAVGTLPPGMVCAGYAEGSHDTCQVRHTVQNDS